MKYLASLALLVPLFAAAPVEFNRDIRPILSDKCYTCHGPDPGHRLSSLRLDIAEGAKTAIAAGDPGASKLFQRITSDNTGKRMPPAYAGKAKLSAHEIELIRSWIEQGAQWQQHWSFIAPKRPGLPAVKVKSWPKNAIDFFVLNRLEREQLKPSDEARSAVLARRVALDLTGLPPSPGDLTLPYEALVDRLLASPRYAERMAVRWLDAARYADTNGYQTDGPREMWRWRDWVIDAFARNMPFDQFTVEQLAGDLLPNPTLPQRIATAFNRNHRTSAEGGIVEEEFRVEYVADRAETTATVWMGVTLGCARCHDHKYDPFKQRDFYRMFAFFNNVPDRGLVYNFGNEQPYLKAPTPEHERMLAELDGNVAEAEQHWRSLQPALAKAQRTWEKSLANAEPLDWTIEGGQVVHATPKPSTFDGQRVVEVGDAPRFDYLDPYTFSVWLRPSSPNGAILSRSEDYWEAPGYMLLLKNGKLRLHEGLRFTDISLRLETVEPVPLNQWTHIAVTYDGYRKAKGVHVYFNGVEKTTRVEFDELTYPFSSSQPFRIGAGGGLRFTGEIGDVRLYNVALTPQEIATLPLRESINAIAAIPESERTEVQRDRLTFCFLDRFAPTELREARNHLIGARKIRQKYYDAIPTVMVMSDAAPRESFVLKRGAYDAHGDRVTPGVPEVLPQLAPGVPANRLGLARWIVDPANPLTARVIVNRYWQMLFGTGLVKTVDDFGSQGEWPANQELLDWLATEFVSSGWNVKHLLKVMVTSATYRQSSNASPELLQRDPENRLLARGPRARLSAEMIRDQALAISGLLVEKTGGPSVKPYQPAGLWQELSGGGGYRRDHGEGLYRRSLYTYWRRTVTPPAMALFDAPTRETCTVRETRTNTPLQALNLMNDETYIEASRKFAERMVAEGGASAESRIEYGWKLALLERPAARQSAVVLKALRQFEAHYTMEPREAMDLLNQGDSPWNRSMNPAELAAYSGVASLILNMDEVVTKQ